MAAVLCAAFCFFRGVHYIMHPMTLILLVAFDVCFFFAEEDERRPLAVYDLSPGQERVKMAWAVLLLANAALATLSPSRYDELYHLVPAHSAHGNTVILFTGAALVQLASLVYSSTSAMALRNAAIVCAAAMSVHMLFVHPGIASPLTMLYPLAAAAAAWSFHPK